MVSDQCMNDQQRADVSRGETGPVGTPECNPLPYTLISPCDGKYLNTQSSSAQSPADNANGLKTFPPLWGLLGNGDIYIHSEAKDCPGTVNVIVNYASTLVKHTLKPVQPIGPEPIKTLPADANAIAAWNATFDACEAATPGQPGSTAGGAIRHVADLLPRSDTTQIAELNQFAGLPLAELGEGSQQQQAQGQADLAALNKFFGTDRTLTTFTGSCSTTSPPPGNAPPDNNASPADAVAGFYQNELAGQWVVVHNPLGGNSIFTGVCSYVTPSAQALCDIGTAGQGAATGQVTVGQAVISGDEALVPVTGSICAPSSPCVSNDNPSTGMPNGTEGFAAAYQAAVPSAGSTSTSMSPMPAIEVDGQWYVNFGFGS